MTPKIFLSPSDQTDNVYAYGNTTEAVQCGKIADALKLALERCGFLVKLMHYASMANKVNTANSWGADAYIPIHTNAFDGSVSGTRMFCYDFDGEGYKLCKKIFAKLAPITPGKSENIKEYPGLYEVKHPSSITAYIEVDFHDNKKAAKWIVENTENIAEAICEGICDYYGVTYIAKEENVEAKYTVQVGAFASKENADNYCKTINDAGYPAFVKEI